jgi:hypothetical protein
MEHNKTWSSTDTEEGNGCNADDLEANSAPPAHPVVSNSKSSAYMLHLRAGGRRFGTKMLGTGTTSAFSPPRKSQQESTSNEGDEQSKYHGKFDRLFRKELYLLYQRKRTLVNWTVAASLVLLFVVRPLLLNYFEVDRTGQLPSCIGQYVSNEAGLFNLPEDNINPRRASSNESCALLFFGLARNNFPEVVLPSIQRNIVRQNPQCDIYVHNYKLSTTYTNPRNGEANVALRSDVVELLTPNVTYDTDQSFQAAHNVTYYRQFLPSAMQNDINFKWSPVSIDNMIRQWHSIHRVWELMQEATRKGDGKTSSSYNRVGFFRTDVIYKTPINILEGGDAVVPHFFCKDRFQIMNDRLFYGSFENAKVWATHRFGFVHPFLRKIQMHPPFYSPGGFRGLHSETFMYELLSTFIGRAKVHKGDMCFHRVRSNGQVLNDCVVPLKYRSSSSDDI